MCNSPTVQTGLLLFPISHSPTPPSKGTISRDGLGFLGYARSVVVLNRGRGQFLNFVGAPGFLASYWSARFGRFLQVSALASHWLEDCANITPTPEENDQYSANHP
jgi:hypothetical protein